ncbi:hypothetical protein FM106_16200 [Brachybacterium faecium]|nr:hypothetical protein FM106_16200 [Brachybacterium faecium]HJG52359.1 hypothetical protein [Brachybacterium faecium]
MTDDGRSADARDAVDATVHRVRLTARAPIGGAVVGCTGAKTDSETGRPHAALDIADVDGAQQLLEVVVGDEITLRSGALTVEQIHPWDPPHAAGVVLRWVPQHRADGAGAGTG